MDTFPDLTVHRQQGEKLCFDENTCADYKLCVCDVKMSGLFEMKKKPVIGGSFFKLLIEGDQAAR